MEVILFHSVHHILERNSGSNSNEKTHENFLKKRVKGFLKESLDKKPASLMKEQTKALSFFSKKKTLLKKKIFFSEIPGGFSEGIFLIISEHTSGEILRRFFSLQFLIELVHKNP